MQVRGGSVLLGAGFASADIVIEGERFAAVDPQGTAATAADGQVLDASGCYVVPGLIDLHFHGCVGHDFCDGTEEAIDAIARHEASCGVTAICPATMTYPEDVLAPIMDAAASYEAKRDGAALVGINMEGPYISPGNIGAQNPAYLHLPDEAMFRRLQERSGNLIKLVDVGRPRWTARSISSLGVVRRARVHRAYAGRLRYRVRGHRSRRSADDAPVQRHAAAAPPWLDTSARRSTDSEVMPELIHRAGVHIHPSRVRLLFAAFGADRVILISDSMMATGLDDGEYSLGGQDVTVRGNVATLRSGTIAGSATDLMACVRVAVRDMGIPLDAAVRAASANPARALGLEGERGSIEVGKIADAVVLDENLRVRHVILRGELLG